MRFDSGVQQNGLEAICGSLPMQGRALSWGGLWVVGLLFAAASSKMRMRIRMRMRWMWMWMWMSEAVGGRGEKRKRKD
jgi:hypothetical protein